MTQPGKKENKENIEKKNKKDTNKSTGEQEMEANRTECSGKGHKHELNKCPLGNVVNNTSLVTNKTPEMAPETQEGMEGIVEATSKRKKNPDSDNERSPDREAIEAGKKSEKFIKDTREMNDGKVVNEKEEGEIDQSEKQVKRTSMNHPK